MTSTQSVEDILRPLVEAKVRCSGCRGSGLHRMSEITAENPDCGGLGFFPDPRFKALRKPLEAHHLVASEQVYFLSVTRDGHAFEIDASLGAIVRAAAMCEMSVQFLPGSLNNVEHWWVVCTEWATQKKHERSGATPEEALTRALVAAWSDKKRSTTQAPNGG